MALFLGRLRVVHLFDALHVVGEWIRLLFLVHFVRFCLVKAIFLLTSSFKLNRVKRELISYK